jgi:hypothetical protein
MVILASISRIYQYVNGSDAGWTIGLRGSASVALALWNSFLIILQTLCTSNKPKNINSNINVTNLPSIRTKINKSSMNTILKKKNSIKMNDNNFITNTNSCLLLLNHCIDYLSKCEHIYSQECNNCSNIEIHRNNDKNNNLKEMFNNSIINLFKQLNIYSLDIYLNSGLSELLLKYNFYNNIQLINLNMNECKLEINDCPFVSFICELKKLIVIYEQKMLNSEKIIDNIDGQITEMDEKKK